MNAIFAAPFGIAAVFAGGLADGMDTAVPLAAPESLAQPVAEPAPDLLAPEWAEAAARLQASDPAKACDDTCKAVVLTEATLPGTGAADLLSVVLEPREHGLSLLRSDGTPALTFTVMPTRILRGEGLLATATF